MTKIETKTFDGDHKPIERHIKRFCIKCGKWYYEDKCTCEGDKNV